jgi:hypothetical protein
VPKPLNRLLPLLLALLAVACGGGTDRGGDGAAAARPLPLPVALAGLEGPRRSLDAASLARAGGGEAMRAELDRLGFVRAAERTLRGARPGAGVTGVTVRALEFESASGAERYVAYVRDRRHELLGRPTHAARLAVGARRGYLLRAPLCGCRHETPLYAGVTAEGRLARWLEVSGPQTTPRAVRRLVARLP